MNEKLMLAVFTNTIRNDEAWGMVIVRRAAREPIPVRLLDRIKVTSAIIDTPGLDPPLAACLCNPVS
jgi:hypothetical protein